jgi:phage shock protein E
MDDLSPMPTTVQTSSKELNRTGILVMGVVIAAFALMGLTMMINNQEVAAGTAVVISPHDYDARFVQVDTPHILLDVRTPEEFASGHIAGAVNIPVQDLTRLMSELPQDLPLVIYCRSGNRSAQAVSILGEAGYSHLYDLGGIINWTAQGYPVQ